MLDFYPDLQWRAWRLGLGVKMSGRVHETVPPKIRDVIGARFDAGHIFHYEGIRRDYIERDYKHRCYEAIRSGIDPLSIKRMKRLPRGFKPLWRDRAKFTGEQPLDPEAIGVLAPFETQDI